MIDKLNSAMRASEVAALTKTLKISNAKVVANSQVSRCALIQESAAPIASASQVQEHVDTADADIGDVDRSFLQVGSLRSKLSFLAKAPLLGCLGALQAGQGDDEPCPAELQAEEPDSRGARAAGGRGPLAEGAGTDPGLH
jgi:hypothetical protein